MVLHKLKEVRRARKLSVKKVAEMTGIHRNRISLIERGKANPTFDTVQRIAKAINAQIIITL